MQDRRLTGTNICSHHEHLLLQGWSGSRSGSLRLSPRRSIPHTDARRRGLYPSRRSGSGFERPIIARLGGIGDDAVTGCGVDLLGPQPEASSTGDDDEEHLLMLGGPLVVLDVDLLTRFDRHSIDLKSVERRRSLFRACQCPLRGRCFRHVWQMQNPSHLVVGKVLGKCNSRCRRYRCLQRRPASEGYGPSPSSKADEPRQGVRISFPVVCRDGGPP